MGTSLESSEFRSLMSGPRKIPCSSGQSLRANIFSTTALLFFNALRAKSVISAPRAPDFLDEAFWFLDEFFPGRSAQSLYFFFEFSRGRLWTDTRRKVSPQISAGR